MYGAAVQCPLEIRWFRGIFRSIRWWNTDKQTKLLVNVLFLVAAIADEIRVQEGKGVPAEERCTLVGRHGGLVLHCDTHAVRLDVQGIGGSSDDQATARFEVEVESEMRKLLSA